LQIVCCSSSFPGTGKSEKPLSIQSDPVIISPFIDEPGNLEEKDDPFL
jgi:hypothetical protein